MASRSDQCEPLLKKSVTYHENCHGCKVEQLKETRKGYPLKELTLVGLLVLCNSLPISALFPFLYFMVRDFHIAKTEDIGYYAGYIGSSFMFGRFLTSVLWGIAADKYGRKPVMLIGVFSVVVFNTLFGLSVNFWMAISMRFLLGSFNGMLGPVKPADKFPDIFSKTSLFGRFPYFLPCLAITIFSIMIFVATFWLPETLHKHPLEGEKKGDDDPELGLEDKSFQENKEVPQKQKKNRKSLLKNWPAMSSISIYCVYSLHDMAYSEIFSLWAVSLKKYGGLGFSTSDVGVVLSITGFGLLIFQLLIFPPLANKAGAILISRIAAVLTIPLLAIYPFIGMLSDVLLWLALICASLLKNILAVTICTGSFILLNNSVPQDQRGAANGLSMTGMSFFKTLGPTGGGSLFAWAQKRQDASFLPGDQMVFFILNVIVLIVVLMTFEPFLPRSTDVAYSSEHEDEHDESLVERKEPATKQEQEFSS